MIYYKIILQKQWILPKDQNEVGHTETELDTYDLQNVKQRKRPDALSTTLFRSCSCTGGQPNIKSKIFTNLLLKLSQNSKTRVLVLRQTHRQISDSVMFCLSDCMPACTWTPACSELPLSIISDLDWFQRLHKEYKRQPALMRLNNILRFIFWTVHFEDSTVWKQCHVSSAFKWRWGLWRYWLLQSSAYSTVLDIP